MAFYATFNNISVISWRRLVDIGEIVFHGCVNFVFITM